MNPFDRFIIICEPMGGHGLHFSSWQTLMPGLAALLLMAGCSTPRRDGALRFRCDVHSFAPPVYRFEPTSQTVILESQGDEPIGRAMAARRIGNTIQWRDGRFLAYRFDTRAMTLTQTFLPLGSNTVDSCRWS